jgi:hypothetical protein
LNTVIYSHKKTPGTTYYPLIGGLFSKKIDKKQEWAFALSKCTTPARIYFVPPGDVVYSKDTEVV